MKNKGFTLVEILAVIVIIGILAAMATLGVTRIRKNADQKDLFNLHSSLETSFENFRTVLVMNGDPQVTRLEIGDQTPPAFNKYITDLSYEGHRLSSADLQGTVIEVFEKGNALIDNNYINSITKDIPNYNSLSEEQKFAELEKQYIIDSTCMVESKVVNPGQEGATIEKHCKLADGVPVPSKDEITCLKVRYKGTILVDDYGDTDNALKFNNLCEYASTTPVG